MINYSTSTFASHQWVQLSLQGVNSRESKMDAQSVRDKFLTEVFYYLWCAKWLTMSKCHLPISLNILILLLFDFMVCAEPKLKYSGIQYTLSYKISPNMTTADNKFPWQFYTIFIPNRPSVTCIKIMSCYKI